MKKILSLVLFAGVIVLVSSFTNMKMYEPPVYGVKRLKEPITIDANWDKPQWKKVKEVSIDNFMGDIPAFRPVVKAKMMYDDQNLYVIFKVEDKHVRITVDKFQGPVSTDACVELFFSPDAEYPLRYFNLEINAGGTAVMAYHSNGVRTNLTAEEFAGVQIAHVLPKKLEQEISEPTTWTLEYKLPLELIRKFSHMTEPKKGVQWKGNFYKTASKSTNAHYLTWAVVDSPKPQFHLPQFFGTLEFK
jgi:hypothetical protein